VSYAHISSFMRAIYFLTYSSSLILLRVLQKMYINIKFVWTKRCIYIDVVDIICFTPWVHLASLEVIEELAATFVHALTIFDLVK
jgi:hypothetical protein